MSQWKISIEHIDDEGLKTRVSIQECNSSPDSELMNITSTLAKAICAFECAGRCVPTYGQQILDTFETDLRASWNFWEDSK